MEYEKRYITLNVGIYSDLSGLKWGTILCCELKLINEIPLCNI